MQNKHKKRKTENHRTRGNKTKRLRTDPNSPHEPFSLPATVFRPQSSDCHRLIWRGYFLFLNRKRVSKRFETARCYSIFVRSLVSKHLAKSAVFSDICRRMLQVRRSVAVRVSMEVCAWWFWRVVSVGGLDLSGGFHCIPPSRSITPILPSKRMQTFCPRYPRSLPYPIIPAHSIIANLNLILSVLGTWERTVLSGM
jgi:hypothetical protein